MPEPAAIASSVPTVVVDGERFRDLDHDGVLAPFEDWRLPVESRVSDLLSRMTLAEKVGQLLHGTAPAVGRFGMLGVGATYDADAAHTLVVDAGVTSMISRLVAPPTSLAGEHNRLQLVAAAGRLGIPLTLSTDPRHHFTAVTGAGNDANGFTQWPGPLGLAATRDRELVRRFADVVRREYLAVGFRMALSPQADLATEPRWPRADGTFGSDATLARELVGAYVRGLQGDGGVGVDSVAAIVKHWVGYGASRDGFDGHNHYGRFSAFPAGRFGDHVEAFLDAFAAGVAGVMPTYNILDGLVLDGVEVEAVGAGFSSELLAGLLRTTHGFDGLVLSDWAITHDLTESGRTGRPAQGPGDIAMCWGVEHLSRAERCAKGLTAGIDQFGGEDDPRPILEAIERGLVTPDVVDVAAGRVLRLKFELGLFEDPFVAVDDAAAIVGNSEFRDAASAAGRRSTVAVERSRHPLVSADDVVLLHGIDEEPFRSIGVAVTEDPDSATVAVIRVRTPSERLHAGFFFGERQAEGALDFPAGHPDLELVRSSARQLPVVLVVHMDRPAIVSAMVEHVVAVIAEFGVDDDDLVANLTGVAPFEGRLPFPLACSMEAVVSGHCDAPGSPGDRYRFGHRADM